MGHCAGLKKVKSNGGLIAVVTDFGKNPQEENSSVGSAQNINSSEVLQATAAVSHLLADKAR